MKEAKKLHNLLPMAKYLGILSDAGGQRFERQDIHV